MRERQRLCRQKEGVRELERKWRNKKDEENKEKNETVGNRWENKTARKTPGG